MNVKSFVICVPGASPVEGQTVRVGNWLPCSTSLSTGMTDPSWYFRSAGTPNSRMKKENRARENIALAAAATAALILTR